MQNGNRQQGEEQKDQSPVNEKYPDEPQVQENVNWVPRQGKDPGCDKCPRVFHIKSYSPRVTERGISRTQNDQARRYQRHPGNLRREGINELRIQRRGEKVEAGMERE